MVTTRRSENVNTYDNGATGGVGLLERPRSFSAPASSAAEEVETQSDARQRMQKNLDKLLNYDRYSEQVETATEVVDSASVSAPAPVSFSDEDIRPTSTTMQFGEDIDNIREEMNAAKSEEKTNYRLNNKGKVVVVLYSLVVTVILALIVLNTGLLANLSEVKAAKAEELTQVMQEYETLTAEIDSISDSNYISSVAENDYGMIKGN